MSDDPEEIEQAVTEAFKALALQQSAAAAKVMWDAMVAMGYLLSYEQVVDHDIGALGIKANFDTEKCIVDAAAAGYSRARVPEFLGERIEEYLEEHEEGDA